MQSGQSLIELLVAMAIFVILIGSLSFLILDSYVAGRLGAEITKADFLAQEGLEAAVSIRDNSWDDLTPTFEGHGLVVSGGHWVFEDTPEAKDISDQLRGGERKIIVGLVDSDPDRKKITSQVIWEFTEDRPQEIQLITYLTDWQKITTYCQGTCTPCLGLNRGICQRQDGCNWNKIDRICVGTCTPCEDFLDKTSCKNQLGCSWAEP